MLGNATSVLVPPVLFAVLAAVALAWARARHRPAGLAAIGSLLALLLLGMPYVAESLIRSLEVKIDTAPPATPPAAIVILGGDQSRTMPGGQYDVGPLSLERERAGARLARRTGLPVLVTGGPLGQGERAISDIMARSLESDFGVKAAWTEQRSETTWQNAEFSAPILRDQGIRSAYVVTQGWHMARAQLAFRRFGMIAVAAPTQLQPPTPLDPAFFIPSVKAWTDSYYAIHEWAGWLFYDLRG